MKKSNKIEINTDCLSVIAMVLMIIPVMLFGGWSFHLMWGWFIVPLFGLSSLSIVAAMGILLTTSLVIGSKSSKNDDVWHDLLTRLFVVGIILLSGFILHTFWPV